MGSNLSENRYYSTQKQNDMNSSRSDNTELKTTARKYPSFIAAGNHC